MAKPESNPRDRVSEWLSYKEINTTVPALDTSQQLRAAQADLIRLTAELTTERAICARFAITMDITESLTGFQAQQERPFPWH
ncbi:hypothetical protein Q9L58_004645 [Maublancomyces gigas]|uniref:Uncharacterized protein n=1 Tax=Discina gigas TaxID=1032678 RepID=A0ABR3GKD2_9PEZI